MKFKKLQKLGWLKSQAPLLMVAALSVLLLRCTNGSPSPKAVSAPALAGSGQELVKAGLWVSPGSSVGVSMRVEPGEDPDVDPWGFYLASALIECTPQTSMTEWLFADCDVFTPSLSAFEAVVPRQLNPSIEATYAFESGLVRNLTFNYVAEIDEPVSDGVDLLWHRRTNYHCGSNTGVWAAGGLVFAPCQAGIVEILDADTGRLLGTANANAVPGAGRSAVLEVAARDGLLYAATTRHGVLIWDVREPSHPRQVGQFMLDHGQASPQSVYNIHTLTLSPRGNLLFAVNQSHPRSDFRVIDVSDPARPHEVGRYVPENRGTLSGGAHDLSLEERDGRLVAYFSQLASGFHMLDVTDPSRIVELSKASWTNIFSHSSWPFAVDGRRYVAHTDEGYDRGMTVLDVTDVSRPRVVAHYQSRPGTSIHNIRVEGGIAYISYYIDGLRIVDLRSPEHPKEIGHYDTVPSEGETSILDGAWGVHLDRGIVYVSDRSSGVYAFRVRLPE